MRPSRRMLPFLFLLALVVLLHALGVDRHLSFAEVREHREVIRQFVASHYLQAVLAFIGLYLATALFLPGALVLTVTGGMLFGTVPAAIYVNIGATTGATLAFLATRYFLGSWIQERFSSQLDRLNRELARHGPNYLLALRILPVFPFFMVNYAAALTRTSLRTFFWTTAVGVLPGSFVYAFAGQQLGAVDSPQGFFSWKIALALSLLALFALIPVMRHHFRSFRRQR